MRRQEMALRGSHESVVTRPGEPADGILRVSTGSP